MHHTAGYTRTQHANEGRRINTHPAHTSRQAKDQAIPGTTLQQQGIQHASAKSALAIIKH
jgi:hypothetical protein